MHFLIALQMRMSAACRRSGGEHLNPIGSQKRSNVRDVDVGRKVNLNNLKRFNGQTVLGIEWFRFRTENPMRCDRRTSEYDTEPAGLSQSTHLAELLDRDAGRRSIVPVAR